MNRVNISIDTLDAERFAKITRFGRLNRSGAAFLPPRKRA